MKVCRDIEPIYF